MTVFHGSFRTTQRTWQSGTHLPRSVTTTYIHGNWVRNILLLTGTYLFNSEWLFYRFKSGVDIMKLLLSLTQDGKTVYAISFKAPTPGNSDQ